jgi:hypothetical protein
MSFRRLLCCLITSFICQIRLLLWLVFLNSELTSLCSVLILLDVRQLMSGVQAREGGWVAVSRLDFSPSCRTFRDDTCFDCHLLFCIQKEDKRHVVQKCSIFEFQRQLLFNTFANKLLCAILGATTNVNGPGNIQ